jgi:hypothetical protein
MRLLNRAAVAVLAGAVIGFVVLLATSTGLVTVRGGRIGGDFPAFYGAGRLVAAGRTEALYDPAAQNAAQADLFPAGVAGRIHFPYPPYVAVAYVPLTWLPFKAAYAVQVVSMAAAVVWAIVLLGRAVPNLRASSAIAAAATLSCYPMFRAVLGGQNTSASLLCAAGAAAAMAGGNPLAAGIWSGAWLFKPQLALPVAIGLFLRSDRRDRFLGGFLLMAASYYAVGVVIAGWMWPGWWWREGVVPFAAADVAIDRGNAISIPALLSGTALQSASWVGPVILLALIFIAAWRRLPAVWLAAATAAAAVLASPHALYYDGGLAMLGLLAAAAWNPSQRAVAVATWALAWLQPFSAFFPIPALTVVCVVSMVLVLLDAPSDQAASPATVDLDRSTRDVRRGR